MPVSYGAAEAGMRGFRILVVALGITATADGAFAADRIRLAQTSTVTACMMGCNSRGSICQSACVVQGTPTTTTTTATITGNATTSATCLLNCSTLQLSCQTSCAQQ